MTALGVVATVAATMFVIKAGGTAIAGDTAASPRTVVATVGPSTPMALGAEVPILVAPTGVAAARPQVDLREIVYTIAGNQRPNDPVTVVYADEIGELQTLRNVTLPWTMTILANLPVNYVTANSAGSQLNCWITDASGATVASQTDFAPSTTCNR